MNIDARSRIAKTVGALALCVTVGALFNGLHSPLPWMIGPLVAMAAFRFGGVDLRAPPGAGPTGQLLIGTALGLFFTPVVAREV
ncbi:MAG: AbrB family transcriptional regulator, partial [Burkholderiales bacterium]